jgi:hypothetical protein
MTVDYDSPVKLTKARSKSRLMSLESYLLYVEQNP